MNEWSLDVLYKGYYDEAFVNDFKKMDTVIQRCTQAAEQLCHDNEVKALHDMLSLLEEFHTLADRVGHFISLKQSTNTSDGKTVSLMNQFSQKFSGITKANARFNRYVAEIEDLDACIEQDALLKEYSYLLHTMQSYMPKFHAYLRRKAELLGYKNGLPWYELFAPLGEETKTYRIEEAKEYLLKHFRPFAEDMADMMERAFDESWIDFFPRKGKVGGAFCANLSGVKQSRVLTNYDGALGDIVTLAHELGHAYHGMMIENHRPLNTDYSMPVAETASTFNENIIMNAAIEEAKGQEKITLIENQLQDLTQVICDIYSRFLFEKTVFEKRKDSFMFADELEAIMIETQKQAYGDGLDPDYLHPYMWICKSHYYSSGLSFYNFPYAFGALFARGLIVKYQEEKEAFVPKYRELLKATTVSSVEDVAAMADIDLCDEAFWTSCLDTCAQRIDEFLELTK